MGGDSKRDGRKHELVRELRVPEEADPGVHRPLGESKRRSTSGPELCSMPSGLSLLRATEPLVPRPCH